MKRVPLVNSRKKAKVDDEDYPLVARFRWYLTPDKAVVAWIDGEWVEMADLVLYPELGEHAAGVN